MSANNYKIDKFENGNFWELYKDLERQFADFLDYVPYLEGNENTYSFRLANLISGLGGHVDSTFKEMARYPKFCDNEECEEILTLIGKSENSVEQGRAPITIPIRLLLKAFEKEYQLTKKRVIFKRLPEREEILPFDSMPRSKYLVLGDGRRRYEIHGCFAYFKHQNFRGYCCDIPKRTQSEQSKTESSFRRWQYGL